MPDLSNCVQKAAQWQAAIRGKPALDQADRVQVILRAYHLKQGSEIEERQTLLNDLIAVAKDYIAKNGPGGAYHGNFISLGMQAEKQIGMMAKAGKGWAAAKKIFAPSNSPHGKSNPLQNYQADKVGSRQNYWLEGLDSKHRSWGHMDPAFFDSWVADTATTLNFFDWLEDKNLAQNLPQVQYLAPNERWKYMCVFGNDQIMYRHQDQLGARGLGSVPLQRFTTWNLETAHSGKNYAIWVCSPHGIFYSNSHKVSEFHHSTFLGGGRVLAAGEWVIAAGKLLLISHKTGHHAASQSNLFQALMLLRQRMNLSRTVVQLTDFVTKKDKFVTVTEFISKSGNGTACAAIMNSATGLPRNMKSEAQIHCEKHIDWDGNHSTTSRSYKTPV